MPLDIQTSRFLDNARAAKSPAPGDMPLAEFRSAVEPFRALGFDYEDVAATHDLHIPNGLDTRARLYVPAALAPPPVVVWVHGGSWVRVSVDLMDNHFRFMSNRSGCAVLAVDYRLAPEAPFPTAVHEVRSAIEWIHSHGAELGVDPTCIAVGGESSGGNIAAAAALLDRADHTPQLLSFQALIVPLLDATFSSDSWTVFGSEYLLSAEQLHWAREQYAPMTKITDPLLSPLHADSLSGLPPAFVLTGEYDPLRDDGARYAQRLATAGVTVEHVQHPGLIHHAWMAPRALPTGRAAVETTAAALRSALLTRNT